MSHANGKAYDLIADRYDAMHNTALHYAVDDLVLDAFGVDQVKGKRVLDVGCGTGAFVRQMAMRGLSLAKGEYEYLGIDPSMAMLSEFDRWCSTADKMHDTLAGAVETGDVEFGSFDIVVGWKVGTYLTQFEVDALPYLLANGGWYFVTGYTRDKSVANVVHKTIREFGGDVVEQFIVVPGVVVPVHYWYDVVVGPQVV